MFKKNAQLEKLSPDSRAWLVAALDPFHDEQLRMEGLPDQRTAPSIVQMHNQSYTLTVPNSAGAGLWDAKVTYSGFDTTINYNSRLILSSDTTHTYDHAGLVAACPFGALNICAGAAGAGFSGGTPFIANDTRAALGSMLGNDRGRLIGVAFEIHNTTAEIYKQGSLTCAMIADVEEDTSTIVYFDKNVAPLQEIHAQSDWAPQYAGSRDALMSVPSSRTWQAADGCYVIPRMTKVPTRIQVPRFSRRTPVVQSSKNGDQHTCEPEGLGPWDGVVVPYFFGAMPSGFSPIEVYLSGLSNQTTLSIKFRTIVEYFPDLGSSLLPISSPSPPFDPKAFALYAGVAAVSDYVVPVDQNDAGDYFRGILRVISNVGPLIAPLTGPIAPFVSVGARVAGEVEKRWAKRAVTAKKPQKVQRRTMVKR